jgi:anti-anti-sigma factor
MLGICRAFGDLDIVTAPAFNTIVHDTIDNSVEPIVSVDCRDLMFIDLAGYHVLVDATQYAMRRGRTLVIRNLNPSCARLIQLFDCDRELRLEMVPSSR